VNDPTAANRKHPDHETEQTHYALARIVEPQLGD
jgi:hypothetical protein